MEFIPLTKPFLGTEEIKSIIKVIKSRRINNRDIEEKVESQIKEIVKLRYVILTSSCSHALELAMMALGIKAGDEVICPSFNFFSTANAIIRQGARPIFAEILEDTLNIDPCDIEKKITEGTKAVVPMHYAGVSCDMDRIIHIAKRYNLFVVEDAAHALGAKYKSRNLGTLGNIGCYSFHESKNITCGEGGALVTNDEKIWNRAKVIKENGTNKLAFLNREVDRYTWVDYGSNFKISGILVAMLGKQLKKINTIIKMRRAIYNYYLKRLKDLQQKGKLVLPQIPNHCQPNWHIFYLRMPSEKIRDDVLNKLKKLNIDAAFHFLPLHSSPFGKAKYNYKESDLPITERASKTLIRLPIYPELTKNEQNYIIDSLWHILG